MSKGNKRSLIAFVCILLILGLVGLTGHKFVNPTIQFKDSIIYKDSLIRDSIYLINDSIEIQIKYIKEKHKQDSVIIMSNDDSTNLVFFSNYVENYNNKRTIKDRQSDISGT